MIDLDLVRKSLRTDIVFEPQAHTYTLYGYRMTSVGAYYDRWCPQFDSNYWSARKAEEQGVDQQQILDEWAAKNDAACDLGHAVHDYIQSVVEGRAPQPSNAAMTAFTEWWATASTSLVPVAAEIQLLDPTIGVAGTADLLCYSKKTELLHIMDWKTNAKFDTDNQWRTLMPPFDHLPDCKLARYSLQTGLYKRMAHQMTGKQFGQSWIIHIGQLITPHKALDVDAQWEEILG